MQFFTTHLLINTLRATLDTVEQTHDVDQNHPGLLEFKRALLQEVAVLQERAPSPPFRPHGSQRAA